MKTFSSTKIGIPQDKYQTKTLSFPNRTSFISLGSTCTGSDIVFEQKFQRKLEFYKMALEKQHYSNFIEVHQWRSKTSLPIVKSLYLDVVDNSSDMVIAEIYYQYLPQRLDCLYNIPLPQGLYLLKESLVGFQRLFDKFGSFYPTDKMIGINQNSKCRVWLNQNINENRCNHSNLNQEEFCTKLLYLIRNHLIESDLMNTLWSILLDNPSFFQLRKQIDIFSNKNKMKIPNRFQMQAERFQSNKIPQNNLVYSKYSSNSILDRKDQYNGHKSQYRVGKKDNTNVHHKVFIDHIPTGNFTPSNNRFSDNGTYNQLLKPDLTKSFREYKAYTPPAPGTPKTPMRYFQSKYRNKTSSIFRTSDIDEQFLGKQQNNNRSRKYSFKQYVPKRSIVAVEKRTPIKKMEESQDNQEEQKQKMNSILNKHGWQLKVDNLLGVGNVKDSIIDGADIPMSDSLIKCEKLDAFTTQVVKSMLPNDLDF